MGLAKKRRTNMRKFLKGAVASLALLGSASVASAGDWFAAAANDYGYGSAWGTSEEDARRRAISDCEYKTGYACYREHTSSVPGSWLVMVVVRCPNGMAAGGSKQGVTSAIQAAAKKLGYGSCDLYAHTR